MMAYESYLNLIQQIDDLVAGLEHHPDSAIREQVVALLSGLDALHREGLGRLVGALREAGAGVLLERAAADPVVEILLCLYDLADRQLPETPQPATAPSGFVPLESLIVHPRCPSPEERSK